MTISQGHGSDEERVVKSTQQAQHVPLERVCIKGPPGYRRNCQPVHMGDGTSLALPSRGTCRAL
jgi:hypothetical protein